MFGGVFEVGNAALLLDELGDQVRDRVVALLDRKLQVIDVLFEPLGHI